MQTFQVLEVDFPFIFRGDFAGSSYAFSDNSMDRVYPRKSDKLFAEWDTLRINL